jgi:hypothetical protein
VGARRLTPLLVSLQQCSRARHILCSLPTNRDVTRSDRKHVDQPEPHPMYRANLLPCGFPVRITRLCVRRGDESACDPPCIRACSSRDRCTLWACCVYEARYDRPATAIG